MSIHSGYLVHQILPNVDSVIILDGGDQVPTHSPLPKRKRKHTKLWYWRPSRAEQKLFVYRAVVGLLVLLVRGLSAADLRGHRKALGALR